MDDEDYRGIFFNASVDTRRQRDFDDLQAELAGLETGRIKRFLHGRRDPASIEKERKSREQTLHSVLAAMLLSDPEYAKLYHDTWEFMIAAEKQTETLLNEAERSMDEIMGNAARLPDGRTVFMDADDNVRTENGAVLDAAIVEGIVYPENAPSYETYEETKIFINDVRHYQFEVLGHTRERMSDHDNPPNKDELEQLDKHMKHGMDVLSQKTDVVKPAQISTKPQSSDITLPELSN